MRATSSDRSLVPAEDGPSVLALQRQLIERIRDGLVVFDSDGDIRLWNAAASLITGWDLAEASERGIPGWQSGVRELRPGLRLDVRRFSFVHQGQEHVAVLFSDCTDQVALREMRERLRIDPLTGVATLREVFAHLGRALALGRRDRRPVGLLYVGIDEMSAVYERFGVAAGNEVLMTVAKRLRQHVRKSDLAGRVGADEFAVVLTAMRERYHARIAAVRLLLAVAQPISADGKLVSVSCSIGFAEAAGDDSAPSVLLRRAYESMLNARGFGGGAISGADDPRLVQEDTRDPLARTEPASIQATCGGGVAFKRAAASSHREPSKAGASLSGRWDSKHLTPHRNVR